MRTPALICLTSGLAALLVFAVASSAWPQGSGGSRLEPPRATRPQTPEEFYASFWRHLVRKEAPYNTWAVLSKRDAPPRKDSPHGVSTTYANKTAAADPTVLPYGSILVREDYDSQGKRTGINVMYRVKGADPTNNDWYWFRYLEDGSMARTSPAEGNRAMAGKVASCIECHRKAAGNDLVFANDAATNPKPTGRSSQETDQK